MLPQRISHVLRSGQTEVGGVEVGGGEVDCRSEREGAGGACADFSSEELGDLEHLCEPWTETHHVLAVRSNTNSADPPDPSSRMLPYLDHDASDQFSRQPGHHAWHHVMTTQALRQRYPMV